MLSSLEEEELKGKGHYIDPKTAMIGWAHQRITSELPSFNPATAMMLLKAESRTVSAALYCKSTTQLEEVMDAALRRAGLHQMTSSSSAPTMAQQQEGPSGMGNVDVEGLLRVQHEFARQLEETRAIQATKHDIMQVLSTAQLHSQSQAEAITQLAGALSRMEERVKAWETWFLPEVMERLPHGIPSIPAYSLFTTSYSPCHLAITTTNASAAGAK